MVSCIALVNKGMESAARDNVLEILTGLRAKNVKIADSKIIFDVDIRDICKLTYLCQAVNRIIMPMVTLEHKGIAETLLEFSPEDFKKLKDFKDYALIKDGSTFRAEIKNRSSTIIDVQELERELGGMIFESCAAHGISLKTNLKSPEVVFYGIIDEDFFCIGIDISGDLSRRDYKIFNTSMSLKGPTAFGLLKIAEYTKKDKILNTFCNSGIIEIEAALYALGKSHRFYDKSFPFLKLNIFSGEEKDKFFKNLDLEASEYDTKITASDPLLRNLNAAKKNAKVAGVEKQIDFRRIDIDWLDTKFEKKTVDKMITFIPGSSKHKDFRHLDKMYKEFFYQAEYIIKDKGIVVVMCISEDMLKEAAREYFEAYDRKEVYSGEQKMSILFFRKSVRGG